ncbi:hypothetical protein MMC30_007425 [Trapelia coarctata]|nr:hypothetical protein [Trapelia coarctata]
MFALYLEIQKQLVLEDLPEKEARGRWKSFVGKWNRGELAEGWYDPATLQKATDSATRDRASPRDATATGRRGSPDYGNLPQRDNHKVESSDDEDIGPALPSNERKSLGSGHRSGPAIPSLQDLELQRELAAEDSASAHEALRHQRTVNRKQEKERLEELTPRAEAGTKERMLEKKKEKAAVNRAFASAKTDAGGVVDVPESELLGDEDGGIEGFKRQKREMERKKNEREIKREEVLRARAEEREERVKQYRAKEEATMKGLIELAKARFG